MCVQSLVLAFDTKMWKKRKSTLPSAMQVRNRRKTISTAEKLDVTSEFERDERIVDVCRNFRSVRSRLHTANVDRITESAKSETKFG